MKNLFLTLGITILSVLGVQSQTIFGEWQNKNEDTGKVDSVIEIYEKQGKAYAKIVKITDSTKQNEVCEKCKGDKKNKKILGMDILSGLKKDGKEWSGGEILDPKSGKVYKCFIKLVNKNKLKVRGYLGMALFGRTVYWHRK